MLIGPADAGEKLLARAGIIRDQIKAPRVPRAGGGWWEGELRFGIEYKGPLSSLLSRVWLAPLLLLAGCAVRFPVGSMDSLPFTTRADSLFLAPVTAGPTGMLRMERRLDESQGDAADYLRVWTSFLGDECARRGITLVKPLRSDSLAAAAFRCPQDAPAWLGLYGAQPGGDSRVLIVRAARLEAIQRSFLAKLGTVLNLSDNSGREYGWLQLDYEVYDVKRAQGSGPRRLVSREPDTPWVSNHMDRAGRLMMKGAKDLARELDVRRSP